MSINDFINKIKDKLSIDIFTLMCLLIVIGVGISAFGLGRLSVLNNDSYNKNEIKIIDVNSQLGQAERNNSDFLINKISEDSHKEKRYVASKNGKLYYSLGCSGAKRISEKNMIWFETKEDAEKSGYAFSSSCK